MDTLLVIEKNQKGKPTLMYNGYRYNRNSRKNKNHSILWRCVKRSMCNASLTTDKTVINILRESHHTCETDPIENEVFMMMNKTKTEVCKTLDSVQEIFESNFSQFQNCDLNLIPNFSSKRDTLLRTVKRYLNAKKLIFNTTDDVFIPDALSKDFVVSDDSSNKIIVFITKFSRHFLKNHHSDKSYFGDATFKCVPKPYYQLYTIHIDLNSDYYSCNVVPVIFALMTNKEESSYIRLFSIVKGLGVDLSSFKCDYEVAQINAYQRIFPNGNLSGCYHHFNAAIFKKAKALNTNSTKEGRMVVRKTAILPLLPPNLIPEAWYRIIKSVPSTTSLKAFKKYFERTWYPHMKPEVLSVAHQRHRTTNAVEGWHRRLNVKIPKRINLLFFIYKLLKEARYADDKIKKSFFESPRKNRRGRDVVFDKKYNKILAKLENNEITVWQFLTQMIYIRLAI